MWVLIECVTFPLLSPNLFLCTPEERDTETHIHGQPHTAISMCTKYVCICRCMWRIRLQCRRPQFHSWVRKSPWKRDRLSTPESLSFPDVSDDKESACNVGNLGSVPGLRRSPVRVHSNPFQYYWLEDAHGQRSLVGCSPWGCKESDMTQRLSTAQHIDVCMLICSWYFPF